MQQQQQQQQEEEDKDNEKVKGYFVSVENDKSTPSVCVVSCVDATR